MTSLRVISALNIVSIVAWSNINANSNTYVSIFILRRALFSLDISKVRKHTSSSGGIGQYLFSQLYPGADCLPV